MPADLPRQPEPVPLPNLTSTTVQPVKRMTAQEGPSAEFASAADSALDDLLLILQNLQEVPEGELLRLKDVVDGGLLEFENHHPDVGQLMAIKLEPLLDAWNSLIAYMRQRDEHSESEHVVGINFVGQALRREVRDFRRHLRRAVPIQGSAQGTRINVTLPQDGIAG